MARDRRNASRLEGVDPRDERDLVLAAVSRDLALYRFASDELRGDRRWVRDVVLQVGGGRWAVGGVQRLVRIRPSAWTFLRPRSQGRQ